MKRLSRKRLTFVLAALCLALTVTSIGSAHIRESNAPKNWYFAGTTFGQDGDAFRKADPVNIVFTKGGTASLSSVEQHIYDDWGGQTKFDPTGLIFLGDTHMKDHPCKMSDQWMQFRGLRDLFEGEPREVYDLFDLSLNSSSWCRRKYHMRLWDDVEHFFQTNQHANLDRWVVGGVHHEHVVLDSDTAFNDDIDIDWDAVEVIVKRKKLNEHCARLKWRWHPGAFGKFSGYVSDGDMLLIKMNHRPC
jgi:hypothetical protein